MISRVCGYDFSPELNLDTLTTRGAAVGLIPLCSAILVGGCIGFSKTNLFEL